MVLHLEMLLPAVDGGFDKALRGTGVPNALTVLSR